MKQADKFLIIRGAREHNLKNINLELPLDKLIVITGLSGSGKSTLAFDTIYAEGQRRYVESLSAYARQFLGIQNKPDVDYIHGLSPAISIEQKTVSKNPRSTVGTVTEINDYLRLLFARIGQPHCPHCQQEIQSQSVERIIKTLLNELKGQTVQLLSPVVRSRKGTYEQLFQDWLRQGFVQVRINNQLRSLEEWESFKLDKNQKHNIELLIDSLNLAKQPAENDTEKYQNFIFRLNNSVEQALQLSDGLLLALAVDGKKTISRLFSQHNACPQCGFSLGELQPRSFSFNSPFGACEQCHGLGSLLEFDARLVIPDPNLSLADGAIKPWRNLVDSWRGQYFKTLAKHYHFDLWTPWKKLPRKIQQIILYGTTEILPFSFSGKDGESHYQFQNSFEGVLPQLQRLYRQTESDWRKEELQKYMSTSPCPACQGKRLKPEILAITIGGKNIYEFGEMSVAELNTFITQLKLNETDQAIAKLIFKELKSRLGFLLNVGLDYLTLNREAGTLSGGEGQRIRLATQIGSELRGVMYILDEPSIGLHQRDNHRLIETLQYLRDLGNTVIVVEHDEETILNADWVVDLGPGAGIHGGAIVATGTPQQIKKNKQSLTGQYLAGTLTIPVPAKRRQPFDWLEIIGAAEHNLKNINVKIPLKVMTCVTGVSGSGKSTLVNDILYKALAQKLTGSSEPAGKFRQLKNFGLVDKVIIIDQSPIGRTPRSNPATYVGFFTEIRDLFAQTKEAKAHGYKAGRFSFNVAGGRCEECEGDGVKKIEMNFLPDVYVTCERCHGLRYNQETLSIRYKGKNIAEILAMSVEEAAEFFVNMPTISHKLQLLLDVGLGYIKLGQPATTLSGGEAQRIKLATELARRSFGNTLYILDEPTTGLHFADVQKLLEVLQRLVERGNSMVVIEHNLDVIKSADYIIDLGPEGGARGGRIIAEGKPERLVQCAKWSYTGKYLKQILKSTSQRVNKSARR